MNFGEGMDWDAGGRGSRGCRSLRREFFGHDERAALCLGDRRWEDCDD